MRGVRPSGSTDSNTKFANSRKRADKHVPSVIQRQRKSTSHLPAALSMTLLSPPQWGMVNYKPSRPCSEDDVSIDAHISWMKQETKKKKPTHERVNLAMTATLADRRRLITKGTATVKEIRDVYPWLFDEKEVYFQLLFLDVILLVISEVMFCTNETTF